MKPDWISVKDRKPPDGVRVLVYCEEIERLPDHGSGILFGRYVKALDECRVDMTHGYFFTHWMPLPRNP